jgi:alginate O-acetyltransferase complex protein AlgI
MLFNSNIFLYCFLPLTCAGYQLVARFGRRAVIGWLALASFVFYGWWNWHFTFVLVGSMLVNFAISRMIAAQTQARMKKFWMIAGITFDLGALFFFKYLFHLLQFSSSIGLGHHKWIDMVLPLGISFFTFTQIAYLIDLAQGEASPQNLVEYSLFVTFFPHLIAGPILHHKEMMPQFLEKKAQGLQPDDVLVGISWFVLGLAKKSILADHFGNRADDIFTMSRTVGTQGAWLGIVLYSLQLYFDFSGYSDMANGLARIFSIHFPMNFNSPYKAINIIDFWQRFHMTLTRYLTLYLYNPISLAVSRRRLRAGKKVSKKAARTVPGFLSMIVWPTMATMFLVGVWHGAGLQFMIFGLLHGIYLSTAHLWRLMRGRSEERQINLLSRVASVLLTYVCVLVAQVFFRANGTGDAFAYLSGMSGLHGSAWHSPEMRVSSVMLAAVGLVIVWFCPNTQEILGQADSSIQYRFWSWLAWRPSWGWSVAVAALFSITVLLFIQSSAFLYFQF